ncbi:MAG: hypothetical protein ABL879_07650 [Devosia sp.]
MVRTRGAEGRGVRRYFRGIGGRIGLALFVAGLVLSPQVADSVKLLTMAGEGAIADYRLKLIPPERYAEEINAAVVARDGDMARSLLALAAQQKVTVPATVVASVEALPGVDIGNVAWQGWNCIVNGDFDSEAGFACVVATDLTSVGDVRDLVTQGANYFTGQPVNYFALGISTVGLTLTAATISTGGGLLPLRAGASFLKAVNKAGKMPPRLAAEIGTVLGRSLNRTALDEAMVAARELRLGDLQRPLGRMFDGRSVARVTDLATDFGRIGAVGGVRAMKASVEVADTARDVKVLAKIAAKYQSGFPAVIKMLGRGVVRLADLVWTIAGWIVAAVLWAISMLLFLLRGTTGTARFAYRMMRRRLPAMEAVAR